MSSRTSGVGADGSRRVREFESAHALVHAAPSVLSVIHELLHIRPRPIEAPGSPRDAFRKMREGLAPRVFISYSHDSSDHEASVLELAQHLRADGIDCWIDRFESSPAAGFPRWMQQQIGLADYVLLICTATYRKRFDGAEQAGKGLGATFEGHLIVQEVYDAGSRNDRFVPVLLPGAGPHDVPAVVRGSKWYELPHGYDDLRRRLIGPEPVEPHALGSPRS